MQLDLALTSQRHNRGRIFYRPTREYFDASRHYVEQIANETAAKPFVLAHHYSGSFPAAIASFGLFERSGPSPAALVGVATFSVPMGISAALTALLDPEERTCELGRFVLLDHVGSNAESWFLSRARAGLAAAKRIPGTNRPMYPVCVSFSDPVPRSDAAGRLLFVGHFGRIYQGGTDGGAGTGMGVYTGRGAAKVMWLTRDGHSLVDRTLNKLRNEEVGARHVYELLRGHGADPRRPLEGNNDYVARVLREGPFRRVSHRGCHRYIFTAGSHKRQRDIRASIGPAKAYPRFTDPV
jgi:hypothetical protein